MLTNTFMLQIMQKMANSKRMCSALDKIKSQSVTIKIELGKNRSTRRHSTIDKMWIFQAKPSS